MKSINHVQPAIAPDHQLPPPRRWRHFLWWLIVLVLILVVFAVVFFFVLRQHEESQAASSSNRAAAGQTVTITQAAAKTGDIGLYLDEIGTVTPVYTDSITSQVSGLITAVHFTEGQVVKKGDPLIDIDSRPYAATLLQAQGALERDQNLLAQAQMDLDRYKAAWARNAIPKQTLDDQEKLVLQDQGIVKNDQGAVQYDQVQVDFCHITAPIAGRVGLRLVDPGNVVQSTADTTLVVITQISPITVVFTIAQNDIALVESHFQNGAKLEVDAFDPLAQTKIAVGTLLTLDNQIDITTGCVKARAIFANPKAALFPNQFVNVRLLVTTLHNVTLIPSSAIQYNGQAAFVYVIQNNVAHMVSVTPGVSNAGLTQVTGIKAGQIVANSGFERLQDKSKVFVAKTPATAPSPQTEAP